MASRSMASLAAALSGVVVLAIGATQSAAQGSAVMAQAQSETRPVIRFDNPPAARPENPPVARPAGRPEHRPAVRTENPLSGIPPENERPPRQEKNE
jgi:hypothetical protein